MTSLRKYRFINPTLVFLRFVIVLTTVCLTVQGHAVEQAPRITDREIIERLTRLEEGLKRTEDSLRAEIQANAKAIEQLRQDMKAQFDRIEGQFNRIEGQFNRLDGQFDRMNNTMLGILAAFTALASVTIGLMLWDRRTMFVPLKRRLVKSKKILPPIASLFISCLMRFAP